MLIEEVGNFLGKYKCSIIHGNFPDLCCSWKTLYFSWMNVKVLTDPIKLFWRERRKNKHKILITRKLSNTAKVGIFFSPLWSNDVYCGKQPQDTWSLFFSINTYSQPVLHMVLWMNTVSLMIDSDKRSKGSSLQAHVEVILLKL